MVQQLVFESQSSASWQVRINRKIRTSLSYQTIAPKNYCCPPNPFCANSNIHLGFLRHNHSTRVRGGGGGESFAVGGVVRKEALSPSLFLLSWEPDLRQGTPGMVVQDPFCFRVKSALSLSLQLLLFNKIYRDWEIRENECIVNTMSFAFLDLFSFKSVNLSLQVLLFNEIHRDWEKREN